MGVNEKQNSFLRALGTVGNERGSRNEYRVQQAFSEALDMGALPAWVRGYRIADDSNRNDISMLLSIPTLAQSNFRLNHLPKRWRQQKEN